ncbi:protein TALPID3-like [Patiria miniata]|uniref:Uncharacterized protein n=1 Tax=Patiria miniata TaxID=46514 RepID=A0A913Z5L4_PATMI|nr:protein TALPID3-like [Patiria miniata]
MATAASFPTQTLALLVSDLPGDNKMLNISSNTSSSSTASSVLIRSSNPPPYLGPSLSGSSSDRRASSSSFSSTGSQRVRIKAKYLREVKSPFEEDKNEGGKGRDDYVPPALPGNLPLGYEQRRETQKIRENQQTSGSAGKPGPDVDIDRSKSSNGDDGHGDDNKTQKGFTGGVNLNLKASSVASLLKQGAPTSSQQLHSQPPGPNNNVRITQFAAGGKQKVFKEQLLKRQESSGPVKRYVRPTMVGSKYGVTHSDRQRPEHETEDNTSNPNTVAAVTAAAVAATVPIVKAQSDLESKMDAMLAKLAHLHEMSDRAQQSQAEQQQQQKQQEVTAVSQLSDKAGELQSQLDEAINKRLQQLEKMQERQMEWQEKLVMANQHPAQRLEKHPSLTQLHSLLNGVRSGISDQPIPERESSGRSQMPAEKPLRQPPGPEEQRNYNPKSHSAFSQHAVQPQDMKPTRDCTAPRVLVNPRQSDKVKAQKQNRYTPAVTLHRYPPQNASPAKRRKEMVSSDNDLEMGSEKQAKQPSPLDTPAPRRHAPRPLTQIPPPKMTHAGRGLLEEILTSHDEEERKRVTRGHQTHSPQVTAVTR